MESYSIRKDLYFKCIESLFNSLTIFEVEKGKCILKIVLDIISWQIFIFTLHHLECICWDDLLMWHFKKHDFLSKPSKFNLSSDIRTKYLKSISINNIYLYAFPIKQFHSYVKKNYKWRSIFVNLKINILWDSICISHTYIYIFVFI